MQQHPLRVATQAGLWLVALAAALLAAVGFGVHATVTLRARAVEFAQLRAIGLSRRSLTAVVGAESLLLCLLGGTFGIGIGALLGWLVGPLVAGSADGTPPIPSVVDIRAAVGDPTASSSAIPMTSTADFLGLAATVQAHLPPALAAVHESTTVSLVTAPARLLMRNDTAETTLDDDGEVQLQIARLTAEESDTVEIVTGRLPAEQGTGSDASVEVVLSQAVADAIAVDVGDRLTVLAPWGPVPVGTQLGTNLQVVGIVAPVAQDAPLWEAIPETWLPVHQDARSDRAAYTRGTLLAADDGMAALGS